MRTVKMQLQSYKNFLVSPVTKYTSLKYDILHSTQQSFTMYSDELQAYNVEKMNNQKTVIFSPNIPVTSTTRPNQYPQSH